MSWSLNEVEALARKAARGAGYSWGEAEEAGAAVRWLEARALPGVASLAALLRRRDDSALSETCPLQFGMSICDSGGSQMGQPSRNLLAPVLFLPFLSWTAQRSGNPVTLRAGSWRAMLAPDGGASLTSLSDIPDRAQVRCQHGGSALPFDLAPAMRAMCRMQDIEALGGFAARTYAPATEASRLSGAGAGVSDND